MKAPPISRPLLEYLEMVFPNKLPDTPYGAPESLGLLVGQQKVIAHLRRHFELQGRTEVLGNN